LKTRIRGGSGEEKFHTLWAGPREGRIGGRGVRGDGKKWLAIAGLPCNSSKSLKGRENHRDQERPDKTYAAN